jgi:hypothetical protein
VLMSLVRSVLAALVVFSALAILACTAESNPPVVLELEVLSIESLFPKKVDVFGIPIHATNRAPDSKVLHAAGVLAQYLDNDTDGSPDDSYLVETIIEHDGRLFMAVDRDELDAIFEVIERDVPGSLAKAAWWISPEGITLGDTVWQDLQAEETIPLAEQDLQFDGSLEEILHLITHVGLANAYPEAFAEAPGSRLADAMDRARGGQFMGIPEAYPEDATYSYYDETCIYQCQVAEYIYWALTSLMGGQDGPGRFEEIGEEWKLNTPERLATVDPEVFALLTDPEYKLPTILPDGIYVGAPLTIETN